MFNEDDAFDGLSVDDVCSICEVEFDHLNEDIGEAENNKKIYEALLDKYNKNHRKAIFEYCFLKNIPYHEKLVKKLILGREEKDLESMPKLYVDTIEADPTCKDETFFSQLRQENFEKIYEESNYINSLSEEDRKNRQVVIEIFSYDPFTDELESDRPQLYRDLAGMATEAMRKDVAKQKAAISIVRSYGNIEKYQRKINAIAGQKEISEESQKQLDQFQSLISKIQTSINQTAEKNNFTVKGIGTNGRGMLSDVMNQIEERGIDEGITNFYDIATSKSIEEVANISMKAQLNQVGLSKTDYADILKAQVEIVRESQTKAKKAIEALRLVKEKIKKQELLEELKADYKKKGISEEEIEEFVKMEYKLYDDDIVYDS